MSANGARWKRPLWVLVGVVALGLLALLLMDASPSERPEQAAPARVTASPSAAVPAPAPLSQVAAPVAAAAEEASSEASGDVAPAPEAPPTPETAAPHPVDLEKLRARLPDNLYWKLGAPTKDEQVLRERARAEAGWNELYGKVLSGTASEEEIQRYYTHRRQVSEDYIAFASLVLQQHGAQLPEDERGLYELSIQMHRTRLAEYPRQQEEALARKGAQDTRRREWRGGTVP